MAGKVIKYVVLVVIVVNVIIIAYVFLGGSTPPPPPMPNPNGYDDFVKAGKLVTGITIYLHGNNSNQTRGELAAMVATNTEALRFVRLGLSRECRVRDDHAPGNVAQRSREIVPLASLGLLLADEGRLAELEGRTNDAAMIYLEGARYGQESRRGGDLISWMAGNRSEKTAINRLNLLITTVDAPTARKIVLALQTIDEKAEPFEAIVAQEHRLIREQNGIRGRLAALFSWKMQRDIEQHELLSFNASLLLRRRTILEFAARAYELEKGRRPQSVTDLVPEYLKAVPKDPVTGKELGLGP